MHHQQGDEVSLNQWKQRIKWLSTRIWEVEWGPLCPTFPANGHSGITSATQTYCLTWLVSPTSSTNDTAFVKLLRWDVHHQRLNKKGTKRWLVASISWVLTTFGLRCCSMHITPLFEKNATLNRKDPPIKVPALFSARDHARAPTFWCGNKKSNVGKGKKKRGCCDSCGGKIEVEEKRSRKRRKKRWNADGWCYTASLIDGYILDIHGFILVVGFINLLMDGKEGGRKRTLENRKSNIVVSPPNGPEGSLFWLTLLFDT